MRKFRTSHPKSELDLFMDLNLTNVSYKMESKDGKIISLETDSTRLINFAVSKGMIEI